MSDPTCSNPAVGNRLARAARPKPYCASAIAALCGDGLRPELRQEAADHILKLPKATQQLPHWQAAVEGLIKAAEGRGPLLHARVGMLRAMHHGRDRVFRSDRKETRLGKRRVRRDEENIGENGIQIRIPRSCCERYSIRKSRPFPKGRNHIGHGMKTAGNEHWGSIAIRTSNGVRSCQHYLPSSTASFAGPVWRRCVSNTSRRSANGVFGRQSSAKQRDLRCAKRS